MAILTALLLTTTLLAAGPEQKSHKVPAPRSAPCPKLDLFAALKQNNISCFQEALHQMDINETNQEGDSPLHVAIRLRNKYAIPFLLKNGADLSQTNNRQQTPRELAELYGFRRLNDHLSQIEMETERLLLAIDRGDLVAANASLLRGASIGTRNSRRDTPLHKAAQSDLSEMAQLLIRYGAQINARNYLGETPLHSAALRDFAATMKVLLESGANASALNFRRETPLDLAMVRQNPEVIALFKKHPSKRGSAANVDFSVSGGDGADTSATTTPN